MKPLPAICFVAALSFASLNVAAQGLKHGLQDFEVVLQGSAAMSSKADCYAGQTVEPGESCTYPDAAGDFEVNSSGAARFSAGGLIYTSGAGGEINVNNFNINGRLYNFAAKGQSDGSWFLEQVGSDTATPGTTGDVTVIYDNGRNDDLAFSRGAAENIMAQRYDVPAGTELTSVMVAPVYDNQFQDSTVPSGAPRDFTIKVYGVAADGSPGNELYSMDVDESSRAVSHINAAGEYSFLKVDFPVNEDALATLPDRIFIGLANKGTDLNYLVFSIAGRTDTAPDDVAYTYETIENETGWHPFTILSLSGDEGTVIQLRDRVFPIRPSFTAANVSADGLVELPSEVTLSQNYPNPFNPSTTVAYALDRPGPVEMTVYDLTGRIVEILVDGVRPAGNHEVRFDAGGLPTGTYLYRLRAGGESLTRTMTLVR